MQIMILLTFAGGYFSLFSHQNTTSDLGLCLASALLHVVNGSKRAGNSTEMGFEEIISAEFLVSLRTSAHVSGFAVIKRALWLC